MKTRSYYVTPRGRLEPGEGVVVNVRGPIGAGKTALLKGLKGRPPWRFWCLDVDAALSAHPSDPSGKYIRQETPLEIDVLGLHAKMILARGFNLLLDQNFQTRAHVSRFLRHLGRDLRDPRVLLIRLTVDTDEAVQRKTTVRPSYVRASHKGFHLYPISEEVVVDTTGRTPRQVLLSVRRVLRDRLGSGARRNPATSQDVSPGLSASRPVDSD